MCTSQPPAPAIQPAAPAPAPPPAELSTIVVPIRASLAPLLRDPRRSRAVNVTLAVVLVATAGLALGR